MASRRRKKSSRAAPASTDAPAAPAAASAPAPTPRRPSPESAPDLSTVGSTAGSSGSDDQIKRLNEMFALLEKVLEERETSPPSTPAPVPLAPPAARQGIGGMRELLPVLSEVVAPGDDAPEAPGLTFTPVEESGQNRDAIPVLSIADAAGNEAPVVGALPDAGPEDGAGRTPPALGDISFEFAPGKGDASNESDVDLSFEQYGDLPRPALAPEDYRPLVDRLENEIDAIVQAGAEEAIRHLAGDIAHKVREHLAIMLPELIGELARKMAERPPSRDD